MKNSTTSRSSTSGGLRYKSPSPLPTGARVKVATALVPVLLETLDLHGQIKVAHWNVKGPHFATLHPLFETIAVALAGFGDEIAERAVTLGAHVPGTARQVARESRLAEPKAGTSDGLELVAELVESIRGWLGGAHDARRVAEDCRDGDTVDILTGAITELEKQGWFLQATLGG